MFFLQNVLSFTSTNSSQNPTAPVTEYCFRLRLSDSFFFCWRLPQKNVSHNGLPVQRHSRLRRGPLLTCSSGVRLKSPDNANHWTLTESKVPKYLLERLELELGKNNPIKSVFLPQASDFPVGCAFCTVHTVSMKSFGSNAFLICPTPCVAWRPCVQLQGTCRVASHQPCI